MREVSIQTQLAPNHAHFFIALLLSSELPLRRDKPVGAKSRLCQMAVW